MNITSFGFELEFFLVRTSDSAIVQLPKELYSRKDACGYLVEARGAKNPCPFNARWLLHADRLQLQHEVSRLGFTLENLDTKELPKEFLRICLRTHGKGAGKSYFMGGHCYKSYRPRAGLHIHFGTEFSTEGRHGQTQYCGLTNMPRIIALMDKAFKDDIKAAKRMPGEYEMKPYGFEYRSLPATVNLDRVAEVLAEIEAD